MHPRYPTLSYSSAGLYAVRLSNLKPQGTGYSGLSTVNMSPHNRAVLWMALFSD